MSEENKAEEKKRGDRGVVGTGSAGSRLKNMHAATGRGLTLKQFVKDQLKAGNPDAKEWVANKRGKNRQKRTDKSLARISAERSATKLAKKAKKAG